MFYYYGRKKRIAQLYPEPKHPIIIEPFAGSAAYSLHGERWKKEVVLYDVKLECSSVPSIGKRRLNEAVFLRDYNYKG